MYHQTNIGQYSSRMLVLLFSLLPLSGCGILQTVGIVDSAPKVQIPLSQIPYTVGLTINASENLNPGADSRPSPVRIRLFLTEPDKDLLSQPFETIFEFDGSRPASDPAAVIVLSPGDNRTVQLSGMMSQTQLIIAAAFHDVYSTTWIANKTIDTNNPGNNTVEISAESVEIR